MGYCCLDIKKINNMGQMNNAYRHNYRMKFVENAIPELEQLNQELVSLNGKTYEEAFRERTESLGYGIDKKYRKGGVYAYEILLTFSREDRDRIDLEKWKKDNIEWLRENFNLAPEKYGDNVLSVVYHGDEVGNVHCHAFVLPIDERGKLNATKYTGSPQKMAELQTSYAQKMKEHDLKRGIEGSIANHKKLRQFYTELNQATDYKLPEYTEKDTPETYRQKIDDMMKNILASHFRELQLKEREIIEAKSIPYQETVHYKREIVKMHKEITQLERKIKSMEKDKEEFEHEFGTINEIKPKLKMLNYLTEALKNEPDINKANRIAEELNELVRRQKYLEKQEREKEKQRKKTLFEK